MINCIPKLNSYVWVKYGGSIGSISFTRVQVIAKGTVLFFHAGCTDDCKCDEFRKPLYYEDYKKTWYKNLKEIRKKYKIRKTEEDYYEEIKND